MKRILVLAAVAGPLLFGGGSAEAWIITQIGPTPGAGYSESIVVPIDTYPGVDLIEIHKYYMERLVGSLPVPIVLQFTREDGDANVIKIIDEMILNLYTDVGPSQDWTDYHVLLISDPFDPNLEVSFIDPNKARAVQAIGGPDRLGGDPSVIIDSNEIAWKTTDSNQYVPWGTFASAPDNQLVLLGLQIDVSNLAVGETFEFKQWPTTPEPATLALLAAGISVVVRRRRRSV